jgi:hypothetical protein
VTSDENNSYRGKFSSVPEIIKQKKSTAIIIDINKNLILGDPSQIKAKENHVLEVKQTVAADNKNSVECNQYQFTKNQRDVHGRDPN